MRTGVLLPFPGIGDMVWHIPAVRAIAATTETGQVTLFSLARSQAADLFAAEPMIEEAMILPPRGRGISGLGAWRGVYLVLQRARLDRVYIFHHSKPYGLMARLAGIGEIFAMPDALAVLKQNTWSHTFGFLDHHGIAPVETHTRLTVAPAPVEQMAERFAAYPKPWLLLATGAAAEKRLWPLENFAQCADALIKATGGTVFLTGTPREAEAVATLKALCRNPASVVSVCDLSLQSLMGLMRCSALLLGNDSGPANVAAAVGCPAFPLSWVGDLDAHSPHFHIIRPQPGENLPTPRQVLSVMKSTLPDLLAPLTIS